MTNCPRACRTLDGMGAARDIPWFYRLGGNLLGVAGASSQARSAKKDNRKGQRLVGLREEPRQHLSIPPPEDVTTTPPCRPG